MRKRLLLVLLVAALAGVPVAVASEPAECPDGVEGLDCEAARARCLVKDGLRECYGTVGPPI